ncbi:MAG: PKD domain-containing protein, partial [Bacteroidota bacterium]
TVEQEVVIVTPPLVGFSSNITTGCSPLTIEFIDESSENTTSWNWDFPGGDPATSSAQNPTVIYDTPGTYSVTLTAINAIGEASTTQVDYIVVEETATAGFNSAINELTVDFTNTAVGATSYSWDFGDTNTSAEPNPSHTYQEDGTYIVTLTVSNDCGEVTVEQEVVIATAPVAGFTSTTTIGCAPFEVQFTNTSSSNASGFLWDFPGGDPSTSTAPNPSVVYDTPGTYDVTLTVTNAVGESTQTETSLIVVEDVPDASFSSAVTGSTVDFTNTTINATSYFWSFGDAGTSMEPNPSYTYSDDGEYLVTLTAVNDCGSVTVTELITIFVDGPSANFNLDYLGNPCAPAQVAFVDLSSDNTESVEWFFPGGDPATSTNPNPIVVYNAAGSYDVILVATNQNAMDTITMMDAVVIGAAPSADFDFVINASTVSFVNNSVGGVTYAWDFGDNNTSPLENPVHTYSQPGTYTVTLEVTNDCGTTTFTQILSISAVIPTASFTATPSSGCAPLVVQFEDQSEGTPDSWEWEFPGGNPSTSTDPNPVVTYTSPGIYDVTLMVSNLAGTNMLVQSQIVEVLDEPTAGFTWVHTGNTVVFTNTSQAGSTYSWDFGDNNTSTNPSPMHEYLEAGVYTVTLVVENECGTDTYTETINLITSVNGLPEGISAFELFPNPNAGEFTVSLTLQQNTRKALEWSVYNVLGQRLEGGFIPSLQTGTWSQSFDWSAWAKGVYVLEIQVDNQSVYRRVVLE